MWRSHTKKMRQFRTFFLPQNGSFFRGWGLFQICGQFSRWFLGFLRKKANRWRCLWHCQKWLIVQDLTFTAVIENSYMEFRICELQLVPQLVQLVDISCKKKEYETSRAETYVSAHIYGKLPTFLEKPLPIWRKHPFWRGNKVRNCPIFFVWPRHIYDRYIFKKNWPKSVSPTLSSAEKNLHPPMWGCHHQLDNQNKYPMVNTKII